MCIEKHLRSNFIFSNLIVGIVILISRTSMDTINKISAKYHQKAEEKMTKKAVDARQAGDVGTAEKWEEKAAQHHTKAQEKMHKMEQKRVKKAAKHADDTSSDSSSDHSATGTTTPASGSLLP